LTRFFISLLRLAQQNIHLRSGEFFQLGGVNTADLYFSRHGIPPHILLEEVFPFGAKLIPGKLWRFFTKFFRPASIRPAEIGMAAAFYQLFRQKVTDSFLLFSVT
jgi:hypothetical protein